MQKEEMLRLLELEVEYALTLYDEAKKSIVEDINLTAFNESYDTLYRLKSIITENPGSLNVVTHQKYDVGLLAAKSLDILLDNGFDSRVINNYIMSLHQIGFLLWIYSGATFNFTEDVRKAYFFYRKHQYDPAKAFNHMKGIDFKKNVDDSKRLPKLTVLYQYQSICPTGKHFKGLGDYYFTDNLAMPTDLGINDKAICDKCNNLAPTDREQRKFKTKIKNITVLKSTAECVYDFWSVPNDPIRTKGGGIQYFNHNEKVHIK